MRPGAVSPPSRQSYCSLWWGQSLWCHLQNLWWNWIHAQAWSGGCRGSRGMGSAQPCGTPVSSMMVVDLHLLCSYCYGRQELEKWSKTMSHLMPRQPFHPPSRSHFSSASRSSKRMTKEPPQLFDMIFAPSSGWDPGKVVTDRGGIFSMTADHPRLPNLCADGPAKKRRELTGGLAHKHHIFHYVCLVPCLTEAQSHCLCLWWPPSVILRKPFPHQGI